MAVKPGKIVGNLKKGSKYVELLLIHLPKATRFLNNSALSGYISRRYDCAQIGVIRIDSKPNTSFLFMTGSLIATRAIIAHWSA